jgi:integrase/recombinase XerD
MKLSTAREQFLVDAQLRGIAKQTIANYKSDLNLLIALATVRMGDSVIAFTPDLAREFMVSLARREKPLSLSTLHRRRASVSEFAKWGLRKRLWPVDPMLDVPPIKRPKHLPRPFAPEQRDALLALDLQGVDKVIRALLYYTGLRATPICNVRVGDCSFAPVTLTTGDVVPGTIRATGKGNKTSVKPMLPELYEVLFDWCLKHTDMKPASFVLAKKNGRPYSRKMLEDRTRAWGVQASVPECLPHRFRHTFATALLERGVDIRIIQVLMDHADIGTTALYTKVVDDRAFGAALRLSSKGTEPLGVTFRGSVPGNSDETERSASA